MTEKSDWEKLWENQKIEIMGDRFNETWLGKVKLEGDNLQNKADLFDANLLLINQFTILKGKHYWRGDELEEMKDKAEKWDELEVIRKAFASTVLEMNDKLEAVRGWIKLYDWRKFDLMTDEQSKRTWDALKEILGEKE